MALSRPCCIIIFNIVIRLVIIIEESIIRLSEHDKSNLHPFYKNLLRPCCIIMIIFHVDVRLVIIIEECNIINLIRP